MSTLDRYAFELIFIGIVILVSVTPVLYLANLGFLANWIIFSLFSSPLLFGLRGLRNRLERLER